MEKSGLNYILSSELQTSNQQWDIVVKRSFFPNISRCAVYPFVPKFYFILEKLFLHHFLQNIPEEPQWFSGGWSQSVVWEVSRNYLKKRLGYIPPRLDRMVVCSFDLNKTFSELILPVKRPEFKGRLHSNIFVSNLPIFLLKVNVGKKTQFFIFWKFWDLVKKDLIFFFINFRLLAWPTFAS